jgi:tetratricopeptide (TPR) repeat protein
MMRAVNQYLLKNIRNTLGASLTLLALGSTLSAQRLQCPAGHWGVGTVKDSMTDQVSPQACISLRDDQAGGFVIYASCQVESFPPIINKEFKSADFTIRGTSGQLFQRVSTLGDDGINRLCVPIEVRLGSGMTHDESSLQCQDDRSAIMNLAGYTLAEANEVAQGPYRNMMHSLPKEEADSPLTGILLSYLNLVGSAKAASLEPHYTFIADVLRVDSMRVRLQLQNGQQPVLDIPVEKPLRDYLMGCAPNAIRRSASTSGRSESARQPSIEEQASSYLTRAQGESSSGNYAASINDYNQALRLQPTNQDAKNGLADAQAAQQQQAEIQRQRQIAQLMVTAQGSCSQGNLAAAIDSYSRVIPLDPSNQTARAGLAAAQAAQQRRVELARQQAAAGEWADKKTQLMWTLRDNGSSINLKDALEYCRSLRTGEFSDWRIASVQELAGIFDPNSTRNTAPTLKPFDIVSNGRIYRTPAGTYEQYHIAGGITLTTELIWSGSTYNDSPGKVGVGWNYTRGSQFIESPKEKTVFRVLCVRPYTPPAEPACGSESAQTLQGAQQSQQAAVN